MPDTTKWLGIRAISRSYEGDPIRVRHAIEREKQAIADEFKLDTWPGARLKFHTTRPDPDTVVVVGIAYRVKP